MRAAARATVGDGGTSRDVSSTSTKRPSASICTSYSTRPRSQVAENRPLKSFRISIRRGVLACAVHLLEVRGVAGGLCRRDCVDVQLREDFRYASSRKSE